MWKSRDEQIIDLMARIETKQTEMHDDIKALLECDKDFNERITSLEHCKTYALGVLGVIMFAIGVAKSCGLL